MAKHRKNWKARFRTLDELKELAKPYATRGELYNKNRNLYANLYNRGVLEVACAHMAPSRKKNKFIYGTLNVANILAPAFKCATLIEFREKHKGAYGVGLRYGVDYVEFFENRDDAQYLQRLLTELSQENVSKFVEA